MSSPVKRPFSVMVDFGKRTRDHMYENCPFDDNAGSQAYFIEQAKRNLEFFRQGAVEGQFLIEADGSRVDAYQQDNSKPLGIYVFWYKDVKKPRFEGIAIIWLQQATLDEAEAMLEALRTEFTLMGYKEFQKGKPGKAEKDDDEGDDDDGEQA